MQTVYRGCVPAGEILCSNACEFLMLCDGVMFAMSDLISHLRRGCFDLNDPTGGHFGAVMTTIEELKAMDEVRQCKAQYFRFTDSKDLAALIARKTLVDKPR